MVASSHDWARLQRALHGWVASATELPPERVIWAYPDAPQPARPFAWLTLISGPRDLGRPESRRTSQVMQDRVTVLDAGFSAYEARIFEAMEHDEEGTLYTYEPGPGESLTDIRNGLRGQMAASGYALADEDDAALLVDGVAGREHFHLEVGEGLQRETVREAVLETVVLPSELTLRVQVESDSQLPTEHARDLSSRLPVSLGLSSILAALREGGLVWLRNESPQDLSRLVGSAHTSRVSQDFQFGVTASASANVPWVRTAQATGSLC